MGERLVVTVRKNNEPWFALYFHWGAEGKTWARECVRTCRDYLKADESLYTNLCFMMNHLDMSGLATHESWFQSGYWQKENRENWYAEEFPAVRDMLAQGIPAGTNRSEGLIMLGPKTIAEAESWAEWVEYVDL